MIGRTITRYNPMVETAGFWRRWIAYSLDMWIIGLFLRAGFYIIEAANPGSISGGSLTFVILGGAVLYYVWPYSSGGQTLGKKLLGIRVISIDGSPLNWRKGLLRTLGCGISDISFLLGYLWAIWDPDKQAWHDKIAGTTVVLKRSRSMALVDREGARRRQKRWLLGLGIPSVVVIGAVILAAVKLTEWAAKEEAKLENWMARVDWPTATANPADVVRVDPTHVGADNSIIRDAREEGRKGAYSEGAVASYYRGGEVILRLWALKYKDSDTARDDYYSETLYHDLDEEELILHRAMTKCEAALWETLGESIAQRNCSFRLLLKDQWIVEVLALEGKSGPKPEEMLSAARQALEAHWAAPPQK